GGAGLRNEKTFSPFAEDFGDCAKSFCGRLRLPARCGARLFRSEVRRGHCESGAVRGRGKMCSSGAALRENRKKDCPLVPGGFCRRPQRRFCARFGRLRLLAGKHVCVPTALSAADAESRQKETFRPCGGRCGTAAGG
ncbi:MAG: hypothetical protein KHX46_03365, partial [Clostridiales bacterium]|nr:hypothetical protein [Clostridiales bacterium]